MAEENKNLVGQGLETPLVEADVLFLNWVRVRVRS